MLLNQSLMVQLMYLEMMMVDLKSVPLKELEKEIQIRTKEIHYTVFVDTFPSLLDKPIKDTLIKISELKLDDEFISDLGEMMLDHFKEALVYFLMEEGMVTDNFLKSQVIEKENDLWLLDNPIGKQLTSNQIKKMGFLNKLEELEALKKTIRDHEQRRSP